MKMNAVARSQLTFQMLIYLKITQNVKSISTVIG